MDTNTLIQNFTKRPVWAQIDLDAAIANIRGIRRLVGPQVCVTSVVKANAYGHGAIELAKVFLGHGADQVAVACLGEAVELRQGGITGRILILGHTDGHRAEELTAYGVEPTVFRYEDALRFSRAAQAQHRTVNIHIAVDTGMGRIGYEPNANGIREIQAIAALPGLQLEGVFTHFAVSDSNTPADRAYTQAQYQCFTKFLTALAAVGIRPVYTHCCSSSGLLAQTAFHQNMVRPGILQYGYHPSGTVACTSFTPQPVMSLRCCITHVKWVHKGQYISYGRHFQATKETCIATIPIGYADGYPRLLSNRTEVLVHGRRVPQVGNICMDQCMIDVTDVPNVQIGDEAVLFGTQGEGSLPLEELAAAIGTIDHEILCNINRRVPRVYVRGGQVVRRVEYLVE